MKTIAIIALLVLGTMTANAALSKTVITSASFATAPDVVIDTSVSGDSAFANATADALFFSPGADADSLNLWMFKWTPNTTISILKRDVDSVTLKAKGDDITIKTDIISKIGPFAKPGVGSIAFPLIKDDGAKTPDQLWLAVLAESATETDAPIQAQLTNNKNMDLGFYIVDAVFHKDTYYVLYSQFNLTSQTELGIWMQGVKASDGSLTWAKSVKIISLTNPLGATMAIAGLNGDDSILLSWKEVDASSESQTGTMLQTTIKIADATAGDSALLRTDTEDSYYMPGGMVNEKSQGGVIVVREKYTQDSDIPSYMIAVFYKGDSKNPQELKLTTPANYASPMVLTFPLADGFVAIGQYSGEKDAQYVFRTFDSTGAPLAAQKVIATTVGNMQYFADANGSVWLAYSDFDLEKGLISKTYLGKLTA